MRDAALTAQQRRALRLLVCAPSRAGSVLSCWKETADALIAAGFVEEVERFPVRRYKVNGDGTLVRVRVTDAGRKAALPSPEGTDAS
jgi:hypothetical protein